MQFVDKFEAGNYYNYRTEIFDLWIYVIDIEEDQIKCHYYDARFNNECYFNDYWELEFFSKREPDYENNMYALTLLDSEYEIMRCRDTFAYEYKELKGRVEALRKEMKELEDSLDGVEEFLS